MVELVCLACGRTNPSDAKFCSQCGAALLRRFCEHCHAVNDADAHFCQACGAELSEPVLPATTSLPDEDAPDVRHTRPSTRAIPTLTQVLPAEEEPAATAARPLPDEGPPADLVAAYRTPEAPKPTHTRALLAVGGLIVLLVAFALWSRAPRTDQRPHEADTSSARSAPQAGAAAAPAVPPTRAEPPGTSATSGSETTEAKAPDAGASAKPADSATEAAPAPFDTPRPAPPAPNVAAERRRSAPATARTPRAPPTPAPTPSPAPATECTRQLDALGLCAPGTTSTGR